MNRPNCVIPFNIIVILIDHYYYIDTYLYDPPYYIQRKKIRKSNDRMLCGRLDSTNQDDRYQSTSQNSMGLRDDLGAPQAKAVDKDLKGFWLG